MEKKVRKYASATAISSVHGPASAGLWSSPSADGDASHTLKYNPDGTIREVAQRGNTVQAKEMTFTESTGAGIWTGAVVVPALSTITDIIVNGVALWNSQTSATLKVGDGTDDDGYFTGVDLKATDLLAGESLSFALAGGKAGAYIANSQVSPRYNTAAVTISAIITKVGSSGTLGRTRVTVFFSNPSADFSVAATKV